MDTVGAYVFSVCVAALLCALMTPFLKKGAGSGACKLMTGIFLLLTVLRPLTGITLPELDDLTADFRIDAQNAVAAGEKNARNDLAEIIKDRTAAYILQKADALGLQLTVEVAVSEDTIPVPQSVSIRGAAAPYTKQQLQDIIQRELGITKEDQLWK